MPKCERSLLTWASLTFANSASFFDEMPMSFGSIWSRHWRYTGSLFTVAGGIFLFSFTNAQSNEIWNLYVIKLKYLLSLFSLWLWQFQCKLLNNG